MEWVAISFPRGSSQPRDRTCVSCVSCTEGDPLPAEPRGKPSEWYVNPDFSEARTCVLLLSGAASDGQSLWDAGNMTSEFGHPEVVTETPSPGLTFPRVGLWCLEGACSLV